MEDLDKMPPYKQLDIILECLAPIIPLPRSAKGIVNELKNKGLNISEFEVTYILNKLKKDNCVTSDERKIKVSEGEIEMGGGVVSVSSDVYENVIYYTITFEGRVLILVEGGYTSKYYSQKKEIERLNKLENEQRENQRNIETLTLILTVAASIGALYSLMQIFEWVVKNFPKLIFEIFF